MNKLTPVDQSDAGPFRKAIRENYGSDEADVIRALIEHCRFSDVEREQIAAAGARYVDRVRKDTSPSMMEAFLAEYGLSTEEGVGLMCLAEALLRVPDAETIDDLIQDKIEPSNWGAHLGHSSSSLVNASTWALMLTGKVLDDDPKGPGRALRGLVRRMGEPVVRTAVAQSMRILGRQFVLGQTIQEGMKNARELEKKGYTYSYDMLGEAARTDEDAKRYQKAYADAIAAIAKQAKGDVRSSPGISVKLSALHPRYEYTHKDTVMSELVPRAKELVRQAAKANIGFNIDAEEQDRLDLSLDIIEALLSDPELEGWEGFGVVVQAYGRRAAPVIEYLYDLAERLDRKIMVRLVKGAYWDTEIKLAQEMGVERFPVFTRKANTDVSYMACARMLMDRRDRIYPQFATHNAHTCAAVVAMAGNDKDSFEFQRLHGMGESLHGIVKQSEDTRCRIYAPVGAHRDLLAYLVRRLLENGANSSFVNQIVDTSIPSDRISRDPVSEVKALDQIANPTIRLPRELFPDRPNSKGFRINEPASILPLIAARQEWAEATWNAAPMLVGNPAPKGKARDAVSPADLSTVVGQVHEATAEEVGAALDAAGPGFEEWSARPVAERAEILRKVADLYEANIAELCAITTREAGKTLLDGIAEVREAVDFLRYYANEAERLEEEQPGEARGVFVCISPWNFPLAIFTGQIAAALVAGNAVLAKPAEQTPIIAARAVALMREAGLPEGALQLLPGDGPTVGGPLTSDPRIAGVCFTGSTEVAQIIHKALARNAGPDAVLIAETGGLNAMIVDSTALTEQAVRDILISSFQSAGQRCSALRMLYVQEDARERLLHMLYGAMDALTIGDPWNVNTDVSPVIDEEARTGISDYTAAQEKAGRVLKTLPAPETGCYVRPAVVQVRGIGDLEREIFGPVLHVASFKATQIDKVVDDINAKGYGLTFGLHTRIDDRVQQIVERIEVGNTYVNRNQIGAIVGSQPFGGEGLSGTGPKAGGPLYLTRFRRTGKPGTFDAPKGDAVGGAEIAKAIAKVDARNWAARGDDRVAVLRKALSGSKGAIRRALQETAAFDMTPQTLPGPTGESNRLSMYPKGTVLCLGPTTEVTLAQAVQALGAGCGVVVVAPDAKAAVQPLAQAGAPIVGLDGAVSPETLKSLDGIAAVAAAGASDWTRDLRLALAERDGPIVPLETQVICPERYVVERHLCIDTTAAGGNASLLAASE
ncbi:bifunctional proline dehydrogenase/L-glutamate gamma-semialdehyde dehydrogenase PutA [Jannaschia seohaensis]|uniref:Bifunctional protein PutA n=1 Tax=Jannaschia seohaensis TaxID=475081 RepID=A0A2Y9B3Y1_9RHOB|nr:bifunctional proline dehydrogenase/L-glutamate gamma-semialdehyde dehydrogenase PutA [Jannaschia seohaensis]PWJ12113.1 RHH-type proline utilization regulon transcriptional repressor/proline dehydrogenase/delta 1-pyrroline-5-carboxylate dehydrogenase [Jannaschia seohaensis]SSA51216.1 RHH-type transcriptional regulator, proline utilization regulon repressor / proline dehydrogenase / delta 1-pyrroline-5-carboxylate dehydrogenase [Jannaschia seohaensis]